MKEYLSIGEQPCPNCGTMNNPVGFFSDKAHFRCSCKTDYYVKDLKE